MATARKKSAAKKAPKRPAAAAAKAKPAARKPAPKPAPKKAAPMKAAPAKAAPAKAAPVKSAPVKSARPAPKVVGKPAVKGVLKPAPRVIGRPAVKGTPLAKAAVAGKAAPAVKGAAPGKPVKEAPKPPPRLVPATDAARAAKAIAAKAATKGAKSRGSNRPEPEVRPLGVLPPSSQARPRAVLPARPVSPSRPSSAPKGTPKPQPMRKGDDRLTQEDLEYFEKRLLFERARINKEMGHLENTVLKVNPRDAAGELSGYSYHMADAGTDSMEREKAFDIASKEGRLLLEIDDALRRLYNGAFGICEISGKPISRARLEVLPWARLSLEEQEKLEKEQRAGRANAPSNE
jgi:RNA polymerase-binding transcription factor DksA